MQTGKTDRLDAAQAQDIAISALIFIANDAVLLPRFLAITGIAADRVRESAAEPGFMAGVLQFLLSHEPTLTAFCDASHINPSSISQALRALPLGEDNFDRSI
jgi:hypothetical protein